MSLKKISSIALFLAIVPNNILASISPPIPPGTTFDDLLSSITNFLYWISFPIAVLMLIVAAFLFVTSGGNQKQLTQAKNLLIYIGIGFLIIVLANGVVQLVTKEFGY